MSSKFCKNQLYSLYFLGLFHNKIIYYFVGRNLPTNSNYFTKIYLLFSVTLLIIFNINYEYITLINKYSNFTYYLIIIIFLQYYKSILVAVKSLHLIYHSLSRVRVHKFIFFHIQCVGFS